MELSLKSTKQEGRKNEVNANSPILDLVYILISAKHISYSRRVCACRRTIYVYSHTSEI